MLIRNTITSSTTAIPNATSNFPSLVAERYSFIVSVPPDWNIFEKNPLPVFGSIPALQAVKRSAADSPTIRPIARIRPVMIPGIADGRRIVRIVCHLPAPSPTAPCL